MTEHQDITQTDRLHRLILDNALDSFVAIDENGHILEWSKQAEKTFGWSRQEIFGRLLADTIVPVQYREAHQAGLKRFITTGHHTLLGRRIEMSACRKDGGEIPIELTVTPILLDKRVIFSASIKDISRRKALERAVHQQENITRSILDSMAGAVVVADLSGRITLVNPAGQKLLNLTAEEQDSTRIFRNFELWKADGKTLYAENERPTARALRGEHVNGAIAWIRHAQLPQGVWVSANARPLVNHEGTVVGAVTVFHDITDMRQREEMLAHQTVLLQEQAELLELTRDAILVRNVNDVITYWNRGAERLYQYSKEEALGKSGHLLLDTRFPIPLSEIQLIVQEKHYWEGELLQKTKGGHELIVFSQWVLDMQEGRAWRYLETNTDITQRTQAERALSQSQENYRLLVEASTDYAIIMLDAEGTIMSWNAGAEKILGLAQNEALGQPISNLFTPEDRDTGEPVRELEEARKSGRSEDDRWHIRRDGSRFWAVGVVTPLWHEDGSLRGFVKILRDQTAHRLAEEQTQFLANHDILTGLPNRVSFSSKLHQAIALSERNHIPLAVLLLDLDRFKYVNDTFGHHVGDLLLKEVALRMLSSLRETDFVARIGGDEFVVIQSDVSQPEAAETLARKLIMELGRPYCLDTSEVFSGTSVGICLFPESANNPVELLKRADLALYQAKNAGRGTYQFYMPELFSERGWKKDREQALRHALENNEFALYYQPQINLSNWTISTVEALLRWQSTDLEMVLPNDFLDVAEETGLIVSIGEWVLRQACLQVKKWQGQGLTSLGLSVNCSARQFNDPGLVHVVLPVLEEAGLAPSFLDLEISEAMLALHPDIKNRLAELRALGVRITIDNYGTGTTALIDLKEFEVDNLKIDKTFVQHLPHRRKDSAITSAIISLAHNLGIEVSAGGVETAEQLAYLKSRDCTIAQGFIFSPPVSAEKFEELMLNGNWSRINKLPPMSGSGMLMDVT